MKAELKDTYIYDCMKIDLKIDLKNLHLKRPQQGTSFEIIDEADGVEAIKKWRSSFVEYAEGFAGEEYAGTSNTISGRSYRWLYFWCRNIY